MKIVELIVGRCDSKSGLRWNPTLENPRASSLPDDVALTELAQVRDIRSNADATVARRALGMVQTTWGGLVPFAKAYLAQASGAETEKNSASESAHCFVTLFKAIREKP